jgi:ribonuclease Z
VLALGIVIGFLIGKGNPELTSPANANEPENETRISTKALPLTVASQQNEQKPDAWYPRTEKLAADEMFVVALGTGMPTPITKGQKSTAWYVELGNGDTFLFDCGTGSAENLFGLRPDMDRVDKVFCSHLHTDHVGDVDAIWIGGWLSGRYTPLHVY